MADPNVSSIQRFYCITAILTVGMYVTMSYITTLCSVVQYMSWVTVLDAIVSNCCKLTNSHERHQMMY